MTNEEAIKHMEYYCRNTTFTQAQEAYRMALDALRAQQEAEKNDPLTLEELRKMKGKPVWIQPPGIPEYGRWAIVEGVSENGTALYLIHDFTCHEYGRAWVAYSRKPEGE